MTGQSSDYPHYVVAVIGGGFSGCMSAVNLLRKQWGNASIEVLLIEKSGLPCKGVAYGTTHEWHYLNVHAANMSALADEPDDLGRYLSKDNAPDSPGATAQWWRTYLTRKQYSDYLAELLQSVSDLGSKKKLVVMAEEVVALEEAEEGHHAIRCKFASGKQVKADFVILALGNASPGTPAVLAKNLQGHRQLIDNPWSKDWDAHININDTVLLLGSGLTMVDKALELASRGHKGKLIALSRHGLLPQPHKPELLQRTTPELPRPFSANTVRSALQWIRNTIHSEGLDWRPVIDSLRSVSKQWWQQLSMPEKQRFFRHAQCYWDVHRHRMAPQVAARIDTLIAQGQLEVIAGRIVSCEPHEGSVSIRYRPRGESSELRTLIVGHVLNCTGSETRLEKSKHPLLSALWKQNRISANELGLGLQVSDSFNLIDRDGREVENVFAIGPPLRGSFFETIAVPELRQQAHSVSTTIFERANHG